MSCIRVRSRWSNISDKCLRTLHLKSKPKRNIQIVSTYYLVSIPADPILYSLRHSISNPALWSTSQATARMSKHSPSRLSHISLTSTSISLMREKAIASTAVVEDGDCRLDYEFDMGLRLPRPRSRASTYSGGMGGRPIRTPRRYSVSRGPISVYQGLPL